MKKYLLLPLLLVTLLITACTPTLDQVGTHAVNFFDGNDLIWTDDVKHGENVNPPADPFKEGYDFIGWDNELVNITKDTDFHAVYEIKKYQVRFFYDEEQIGETQLVEHGSNAVEPEPIKVEGMYFSGWDKPFTNVKSDLDIFATYSELPHYHVIIFGDIEGLIIIDQMYVQTVDEIVLPNIELILVGYKYIGWDELPTELNKNLEIYPIFEEVNQTYSIELDEYVTSNVGISELLYNQEVTLSVSLPDGVSVKNFYLNNELKKLIASKYTFRITEDMIVLLETFEFDSLEIFYLNDFHGSILPNFEEYYPEIGMAGIANFIKTKRAENPNSIFLTGGDMLQGSALSNYYYGESVIELLNLMDLDAFVIGNHEFDWGIEEVTKYFEGQNPVANFPLLAANVFEKGSNKLLDTAKPYTILERAGFKIGVIGYLGYGLESSIAYPKVKDYEFRQPVPIVANYSTYLREVEEVDFVIVVGHDGTTSTSIQIGNLQGSSRIDMVFAGHSHSDQVFLNSADAPIVQSWSNGRAVGYVEVVEVGGLLTVNKSSVKNYNYHDSNLFKEDDFEVASKIAFYQSETNHILKEVLIYNPSSITSRSFATWLSKFLLVITDSDVGVYNTGGVRDTLPSGNITLETLYKIIPFDNKVKSTILNGYDTNYEMGRSANVYYTNMTINNGSYYKVVTNDYVFDYPTGVYQTNADPSNHIEYEIDVRSLVAQEFKLQYTVYGSFNMNNIILLGQIMPTNQVGDISGLGLFI